MAFQIIRHAFRMIFGNFGQALRVSVGPYLLFIVALVIFGMVAGRDMMMFTPSGQIDPAFDGFGLLTLIGVLFFAVLGLFVFGWVAVSWHRFILLEEMTTTLPAIADRPIWPYVGRSILYGIVVGLAGIPVFLIIGAIAAAFGGAGPQAQGGPVLIALSIVGVAILAYVWFRIAIALPAVAVGKPMGMRDAWSASAGLSRTILGVAFLLMVINGVAGIVVAQITGISVVVGAVFEVALQWTTLMLGISILTTFYGHLIENRPLPD